jgi:D-sedoheptulose 7-phosphate isomerase
MKSTLQNPSLKPMPISVAYQPDAYWRAVRNTLNLLDWNQVESCLDILRALKARDGRLFILGVGGSAANASHAVNDFRKIAGIEAYAPTDNVAELTARTNDDGWISTFSQWLDVSRCSEDDVMLVLSVGGGSLEVSRNIWQAVWSTRAQRIGIVGPDGGSVRDYAEAYVTIPAEAPYITPLVESFQPLVWHYWVNAL